VDVSSCRQRAQGDVQETYHLRIGAESALNYHLRLHSKVCRCPKNKIRHLPNLNTANEMAHSLRDRRIDSVFADVPLDSEIVGICAFVLLECATLDFVLVCGIPGAEDDLSTSTHGLRI
jgi:hypothetical protein